MHQSGDVDDEGISGSGDDGLPRVSVDGGDFIVMISQISEGNLLATCTSNSLVAAMSS